LAVWERELANDSDGPFLLNGIEHGFHIVDDGSTPIEAEMDNYSSAVSQAPLVEKQIVQELVEGRYVKVPAKPPLISALGAIPKADGDIRLIHDCSQPVGRALNDFATNKFEIKYQTLRSATKHLSRGCYLAKVDLKGAYRSVGLHPSQHAFTGLKWKFAGDSEYTYMVDKCLPFGARKSPGIFHRLTQAVRRMMERRGFIIVVYLDDFLLISRTKEHCTEALNTLIGLLRLLGFCIAWNKTECPTQCLTFLGVTIDTCSLTLHLPADKVEKMHQLLASFQGRKRASCRQLQQLAGRLSWASYVVNGGRIYLQRVLDLLRPLRHATHKVCLSQEFQADISWWLLNLTTFNCKYLLLDYYGSVSVFTDASNKGAGIVCENDWAYIDWALDMPFMYHEHINIKETIAVIAAVYRWAPSWAHCKVTIHTDNITTRAAINKGVCRNPLLMQHLRVVFWLSVIFNFEIHCVHIPGRENYAADTVSRLRTCGHLLWWYSIISGGKLLDLYNFGRYTLSHVSPLTLRFLISQIPHLVPWWKNWTPLSHTTGPEHLQNQQNGLT